MTHRSIALQSRTLFAFAAAAALASPALAVQVGAANPQGTTRAGLQKTLDARFAQMDSSKDGILSRAEIEAAHGKLVAQAGAVVRMTAEEEFKLADADKNGSVSEAEIAAIAPPARKAEAGKALARLDADKNGSISRAEFLGAIRAPKPGSVEDFLARFDGNKDGKVTKSEYVGPALSRFDGLDANKDGVVSAAESQKAAGR